MKPEDMLPHEVSSGNVFEDLELPESDAALAKAELVRQIAQLAQERRLTQAQVAAVLSTTQPKVSDLFAGKLAGFSMERLIRYINAMGCDVRIDVSRVPRARRAGVRVTGLPAGTCGARSRVG